jgi:hypothetical protein
LDIVAKLHDLPLPRGRKRAAGNEKADAIAPALTLTKEAHV